MNLELRQLLIHSLLAILTVYLSVEMLMLSFFEFVLMLYVKLGDSEMWV